MGVTRRQVFERLALAAAAPLARAAAENLAMPGPLRGNVVAVEHPGCILHGAYQSDAIARMMRKGMTALTGAPDAPSAWRQFFEKGDVVGIKVCPGGGRLLSSDASVLHAVFDGLKDAGVPAHDVIVFNRYKDEIVRNGIDRWIPDGSRWEAPSERYSASQLDMEGYDPDQYMEMPLVKPGDDPLDAHFRRSYVARVVTREVNKIINMPVLKHHQSAGVTLALKNLSHGCANNVYRSHPTPTLNACGAFIPAVVSLPVFRRKVVLHILDGVKGCYHGGPNGRPQYIWENKTMYFATDPVAMDKVGWKAIDARRQEAGMAPIALSKPDRVSTYLNCQVEHIEIAGTLQLGAFSDDEITLRRYLLG